MRLRRSYWFPGGYGMHSVGVAATSACLFMARTLRVYRVIYNWFVWSVRWPLYKRAHLRGKLRWQTEQVGAIDFNPQEKDRRVFITNKGMYALEYQMWNCPTALRAFRLLAVMFGGYRPDNSAWSVSHTLPKEEA